MNNSLSMRYLCALVVVVIGLAPIGGIGTSTVRAANEIIAKIKIGSGSETTLVVFNAGASQTLTWPSALGNDDILIRIYDQDEDSGVPAHSIGAITINGSATADTTGKLMIMVADAAATAFPFFAANPLEFGAVDFGGLTIPNADLRARTRTAIAVIGDITGNVVVGQVHRIETSGTFSGDTYVSGGRILGDITAVTTNGTLATFAIDNIRAGRLISGAVTADAGEDPAGINRVVVGPNTSAAGITGDIKAEHGKIGFIYSTGPIGSVSITPKIYAGNGIEEIRTINESFELSLADIKADIQANRHFPTSPDRYTADAVIKSIETGGSLKGSVKTGNLVSLNMLTSLDGQAGIVSRGPIDAEIIIDHAAAFTAALQNRTTTSLLQPAV